MNLIASTAFGIESCAAFELKKLGAENVETRNGRIDFQGDFETVAKANMHLRCAERVFINMGEFKALTFEDLFQGTKAIAWEEFLPIDACFPVSGKSVKSTLHSVPDCQAIVKKAIVERLKIKYKLNIFPETGSEYKIRFSIHKNNVTVMIDTSGDSLHKRGYRRNSNSAPIKETLAASMCDLARIYPDTHIYDPFCGSGTILIEAAMMAKKLAPGLRRYFAAERFGFIPQNVWREERTRAQDLILNDIEFEAYGFDIDDNALELTKENAAKAGVSKYIKVKKADVKDFKAPTERSIIVTNPPYGERLLDVREAEKLYRVMGENFQIGNGRKAFVISPHDEFEKHFGAVADKRRKLYNGMIKCQLFMYFK